MALKGRHDQNEKGEKTWKIFAINSFAAAAADP